MFLMRSGKRALSALLAVLLLLAAAGCGATRENEGYGVFLGVTENLDRLRGYDTVVIDAQYFDRAQIAALQSGGTTVYSYLNIGSLEDFRDYYDDWRPLTLGEYEHWDGEFWVDVSDKTWQDFVTGELASALLDKGVDGFFIDNCDVYDHYPSREMRDGLATVLRALRASGKAVVLNGGDVFLDAYCADGGQWSDLITGINQESVFTAIRWDEGTFAAASEEDRAYFTDYVERYAALGAEIYLLEYTRDRALIGEIEAYCEKRGFSYYIAPSLALD